MSNLIQTLFPTSNPDLSQALSNALYDDYKKTDRFMLIIQGSLWLIISLVGLFYENMFFVALVATGLVTALSFIGYSVLPGSLTSRSLISAGFMLDSAILIQISNGLIEMHFLIFVLLAVLILYKDISPLIVATVVVYVHHLGFSYLQGLDYRVFDTPIIVFNYDCGFGIVMLHAAFVIAELVAGSFIILRITNQFMRISDLEIIVDELSSISDQTKESASEISEASSEIADGANKQSEYLDDIKERLNEILSSVGKYLETTQSASAVTTKASMSVNQLKTAIDEINKSSRTISGIIKTIDGIAFQTNILSLNAAVEAARAGEAGKGFGVVSEEVRNLSVLTSSAATDIEQKISASIKRTTDVVHLLDDLVGIFDQLQEGIKTVEVLSNAQRERILTVNQKTIEIDQVIVSNSVLSLQHKDAAQELLEQVDRQKDVVEKLNEKFRLN